MKSIVKRIYPFAFLIASLLLITSCASMTNITQKNAVGKPDDEIVVLNNYTEYTFTLFDKAHLNPESFPGSSSLKILPGDYFLVGANLPVRDRQGITGDVTTSCSAKVNVKAGKKYYVQIDFTRHVDDTVGAEGMTFRYDSACSLIEE